MEALEGFRDGIGDWLVYGDIIRRLGRVDLRRLDAMGHDPLAQYSESCDRIEPGDMHVGDQCLRLEFI